MAVWDGDRQDDNEWDEETGPAEGEADGAGDPAVPADNDDGARLDLDDDERLPWLESVDDDEADEGSDTGRMIAFLVGGLIVLAALVGGIWWATHRDSETELLADGSVIPAPAEPYKQAPEDPGGKTFAGTGDTSYAVSEGQSRPPRLAGEAATPAATASAPAKAEASPAPTASATPSGVGVQVGAYSSREGAETGWTRLSQQHDDLFSGLKHRIVEGRADIGTVYRLQALADDRAAANALCSRFKAAGVPCQVKD
jgi:cell division septation protein DedD